MNYIRNLVLNSGKSFKYCSILDFFNQYNIKHESVPFVKKIILENYLRHNGVANNDILSIFSNTSEDISIPFMPGRVLMQDFTGVPAIVDLAAMRKKFDSIGKDPQKINPLTPTHLVIDHSIQVDDYAHTNSAQINTNIEFQRNKERYEFLKWGKNVFQNFNVVPPGYGICHQVNVEYLSQVVCEKDNMLYPDTLVGTDSHTTMANGIGVLGWGVGGIEAEAVMLNEPLFMTKPVVVGVKLTGKLSDTTNAMDLVLTITHKLRKHGVVNKFVEFYGDGAKSLAAADRLTISNMAPEYGATCGIFHVDNETINYLKQTGRDQELLQKVEEYYKAQSMWNMDYEKIVYDENVTIDLNAIQTTLAGPKRPQDMVLLANVPESYKISYNLGEGFKKDEISNGSVAIAAITSCTNTSNPYGLIAAALFAKKASEIGLKSKDFVKTSFGPGSKVVKDYLENSGLQKYLDNMGFNIVGYGCTTCIGNSGPLNSNIETKIKENNYNVAAVISGNRNFEGRVHPLVKANYLASPMIVVAYAIAGNVNINLHSEPLGNVNGRDIFLRDICPKPQEINQYITNFVTSNIFKSGYKTVFDGEESWKKISVSNDALYNWKSSTYIEQPPYFEEQFTSKISDIQNAKIIAVFGDSITTDHISPAGDISIKSPAGEYLMSLGVAKADFNSYGARRGSHNVMMRGTFANIRIKNELLDGVEGGMSVMNDGGIASIYDVAMENIKSNRAGVIFAGKEYGTGSSRDWAAKGTKLLGINAVIAESFERIHRSNLVGMGVLPLEFINGENRNNLNLKNCVSVDILGINNNIKIKQRLKCILKYKDRTSKTIELMARLDTEKDLDYYKQGGIFNYVINKIV